MLPVDLKGLEGLLSAEIVEDQDQCLLEVFGGHLADLICHLLVVDVLVYKLLCFLIVLLDLEVDLVMSIHLNHCHLCHFDCRLVLINL